MNAVGHLLIEPATLPPGGEWRAAAEGWYFLHLTRGAAYWLGSDRPRSLTEGEMMVVPPDSQGAVRASQIGPVVLHALRFVPDLLCGFFTLSERHFFESGTMLKETQFLPSTHPVTQQFAALTQSLSSANSLMRRIQVLSLVAMVFDKDVARHQAPEQLGATALHRFTQLIADMPDTEIINHTPEQLARLCGCSPRHFNRLFRHHFGASARSRQTELRLLKARQLLCDSDSKIIQVAMESGYRNLSLFNSLFKRRFGTTPSAWRRKSRKRPVNSR